MEEHHIKEEKEMAYNIIRPRRGIKSLWQQYKNRIYKQGEMLVESPESGVGSGPVNVKFGDGVTDYEHLPYAIMAPIHEINNESNAPISSKALAGTLKRADVVDNLLSDRTDLPLSAKQGSVLKEKLTTSNGMVFQFAYNATTEEYGYMAKVEGADTFFPFSNAKKLYESLQYSGLVTEDMSFNEMCEVLATYFPAGYYLYNYGDEHVIITGGYSLLSATSGTLTKESNKMTVYRSVAGENCIAYTEKTVDLSGWNYMDVIYKGLRGANGYNNASAGSVHVNDARQQTSHNLTTLLDFTESNVKLTIDISALNDDYYIGVAATYQNYVELYSIQLRK